MRLERSSALFLTILFVAITSFVVTGCQQATPEPEDVATSEAVVAAEEPVEVVEEAPAAEETVEEVIEEAAVEEVEPAVEEAPMEAKESHTVEKGEHLWGISESQEVYADPFQWPLIYKANRDQIKDPDLIYPDQVFEIPRDSSQEDVDAAIHEAKTRGPWSLWDGK